MAKKEKTEVRYVEPTTETLEELLWRVRQAKNCSDARAYVKEARDYYRRVENIDTEPVIEETE